MTLLIAHRVFLPAVSQAGPQFLMNDHLLHVLQRRMLTHFLLKRQHVLVHWACKHTTTCLTLQISVHLGKINVLQCCCWCVWLTVSGSAPRCQLPEDEAEGVHVDTQEGVALEVDGTLKDFRSHVAPCSHLQVQRSASGHQDRKTVSRPSSDWISLKMGRESEFKSVTSYRCCSGPFRFSQQNKFLLLIVGPHCHPQALWGIFTNQHWQRWLSKFPNSTQVSVGFSSYSLRATITATFICWFEGHSLSAVPVHECLLLIFLLQTAGQGQSQLCRRSSYSSTAHSCS